jgi:hypothetical protein
MVISLQKWRAARQALEPLNDLDWRIVETARADGPRSFNPDGIVAQLFRILGMPVARRLTNDALEALRRFSVRAWYWDLIRTRDLQALLAAGYSRAHAQQILSHVAASRGFTPSIQEA